ncbi:Eukaryotic aspartyl protease [Aphelenchoides bicaudatus]|nr:Eukaryotic aspartyl protease [Aphelenchoides bicaudatus]
MKVYLAFLVIQQKGSPLPVFQQAVKEGLMDRPIFTSYMRKCDGSCENGGLITLGGLDKEHCRAIQGWVNVDPNAVHWRFQLQGIGVNGYQNDEIVDAITDTDMSLHLLLVRKELLTKSHFLLEPLQASGLYILPCNKKFTVTLRINGLKYPISANQLLLKESDFCILAMSGTDDFGDLFILGNPFVRQWCQIHDVKKFRVGFALAKQ